MKIVRIEYRTSNSCPVRKYGLHEPQASGLIKLIVVGIRVAIIIQYSI